MLFGLFEMCNPHLLPTEVLSEEVRSRLAMPVLGATRSRLGTCNYHWKSLSSQLILFFSESPLQTFKIMTSSLSVEWYSVNLSPKCQRIHRENRRGKTLRRRQRPEALQIKAMPDKELSTSSKRPAPVSSEAPQKKRTKISWPWYCYLLFIVDCWNHCKCSLLIFIQNITMSVWPPN